jgi:hypothetical protein
MVYYAGSPSIKIYEGTLDGLPVEADVSVPVNGLLTRSFILITSYHK